MEQKIIDYLESENRFARENFEQYKADVKQFKKDKKLNLEMCMHTPVYTSEKQVSEKIEWNNTIITALKKQIPMKPIPDTQPEIGKFIRWECPGCRDKRWIGFFFPLLTFDKVCTNCLQAIDWEFEVKKNDD